MPSGIDESYSFADPVKAYAAGVRVVMLYLSQNPAKNATPAKVHALHSAKIAVFLGYEDSATRALQGYNAGLEDGQRAAQQYLALEAQVKALYGYSPRNLLFIAPAVDFDTDPTQYPEIDAYLRGFAAGLAHHFGQGVYGEADLLDHLHAVGLLKGGGFGTYAWSQGRISGWDDFHQYLNNQTLAGASVDFDNLINPSRLGAWWPPGSQYDVPAPSPWEDNVAFSADGLAQIKSVVSDVVDAKLGPALYQRAVADRAELIALARAIVNGVASGEFNEKNMANVVGDGGLAGKVKAVGAAVAAESA